MSRRRKLQGPEISGVLPVAKPSGMTSHDVVDRVRRILNQRSVGHTGTLDPAATGLLVLCIGTATRFARYLSGLDKTYRAVVRFGQSTDSFDSDGQIVASYDGDISEALTAERLNAALEKYSGEYSQLPPAFSAKKIGGVAAYKLARRGEKPELKPVTVRVDEMVIGNCQPPDVELELSCSTGFYVRALARDLGDELGTGAHLYSLERTRVGLFELSQASTLEALAQAGPGRIEAEMMVDFNEALRFMPAVDLSDAAVERYLLRAAGGIDGCATRGSCCLGRWNTYSTYPRQWWRVSRYRGT